VVRIERPPPRRPVQPVVHALAVGERLLRIYSPGEWNNTAITFRRRGGPRLRFDHHLDPEHNLEDETRGIHYSARSLEGCLVEVFGDDGLIATQDRRLGALRVGRSLRLLDLRGEGAWKAGATQAICSCPSRAISQEWARYFYETEPKLDGLIYGNAHNGADAIALFERADGALSLEHDLALADPRLGTRLLAAAAVLQLMVLE
jgi:hypothetical protein